MSAPAVLLALAAAFGRGGDELLVTTSIRPAAGHELRRVWLADLDGDGGSDLFLATCDPRVRHARRLAVHLRDAGGAFAATPAFALDLTPDVVACAVGDVHPDPGRELVLFGARGVFAWRPSAPEAERVVRLLEGIELLWQLQSPEAPLHWGAGVRDLDGDGRDELIVPEPEGFRVARRGAEPEAGFDQAQLLRLPSAGEERGSAGQRARRRGAVSGERRGRRLELGLRLSASNAGDEEDQGPLLTLTEELPAPRFADWDGDGDLDLVAEGEERLYVWRQQAQHERGSFEEAPSVVAELPLAPREERGFELVSETREADLDRDGRVDVVLLSTDRHSEELRTQVLVFLQAAAAGAPPFGDEGVPTQLLVLGGFAGGARLVDVDGDGALDLACVAFRPDQIDQLVSVASDRVDGQLSVFLGSQGRGGRGAFSSRPDLVLRVALGDDPGESGGGAARFLPDLNGDGILELLERDTARRLALRLSRRTRERGLAYGDEPAWTLALGEEAEVLVEEPRPGARAELLVVEPHELRHARLR